MTSMPFLSRSTALISSPEPPLPRLGWSRRSLASVLAAAVLSAWPVSSSQACEAMTGGEYTEPPEYVTFDLPASDWHVAFRGVNGAAYARKELVPPDETLVNWTQLVTWHVTFGRNRFDLPTARDAFLSSLKSQCSSVQTQDIQTDPKDLIYEWWHEGCYNRPPQHQIMRLIAGATGTHTIAYGRKGRKLEPQERAQWLERISSIQLKRRIEMEGDLSTFDEAQMAVWNGEYDSAVKLLTPMAEKGNADAQELLGRLYFEGWGVTKDYAKSREWFEKAVAKKHVRATYSLAQLYDGGFGVTADPKKALELYRTAAKGGIADAEGRIGYLLVNGPSEMVNPKEAYGWFERALANGHTHARFWLGRLHEDGIGAEKDVKRAAKLYHESASEGEPDAQYRLGMLYATGKGVEKDEDEAKKWLIRAAMQGNESAREFYNQNFPMSTPSAESDDDAEAKEDDKA